MRVARHGKKKYSRILREARESTGALSDGGVILNLNHEIVWKWLQIRRESDVPC